MTGQDGSYLADLLLSKGYRVVGVVHSDSRGDMSRIAHCLEHIEIVRADLASEDEVLAYLMRYALRSENNRLRPVTIPAPPSSSRLSWAAPRPARKSPAG